MEGFLTSENKHPYWSSKRELIYEIVTWSLIVLATVFVIIYFPSFSALFYVLTGATLASSFWYLRSRRLYLQAISSAAEANRKSRELIRQRQTSQLFFDHSSDGILIVDDNKRIIDFSAGLEKMTGFRSRELLGKIADHVLEFQSDAKTPPLLEIILRPKNFAKNRHHLLGLLNNSLKTANGHSIQVEINFDNFKDPVSGRLIGLAVLRDVTIEMEVRERDREFVSMASHQMFTPLSMIRGFLSLMLNSRTDKLAAKQKDYAEEAYRATKRLISLVMSLLSTSRIDGEKTELHLTKFDLIDLVQKMVDELKKTKLLVGNSLSLESDQKVIMLEADQEKISQAISICLDNALKYTDNGQVKIVITKLRNQALIKIIDNGIGIPENEIDRVYSKFYRGSNAMNRDTKGTGLGLFISQFMVEKHHGKINIKSKIGQGTELTITLPLAAKL
jgi:PAS domain S-box-containing protein